MTIEDIPQKNWDVQLFHNDQKKMVIGAIYKIAKFRPKTSIISAEYYKEQILQRLVILEATRLYPNGNWTFQQDSAPAHTAKMLKGRKLAKMYVIGIASFSPDLNPLDYCL